MRSRGEVARRRARALVAVLAAAALAACSGGRSGAPARTTPTMSAAGDWIDTFDARNGGRTRNGEVRASFHQEASGDLIGTIELQNAECFSRSMVDGYLSGTALTAWTTGPDGGTLSVTAKIGSQALFMDGTFTISGGLCHGSTGTFTMRSLR